MARKQAQSLEDLQRDRRRQKNYTDHGCNHMPSQEEIAAECLRIQATWTPGEEQGRRLRNPPATIPRV